MDTFAKDNPALRVALILVDGFALMSYASLAEPFRAANLLAERQLYRLRNIPTSGVRAVSSSGASVEGTARPGDTDFDLAFVVAGSNPVAFDDGATLGWLRRLARRNIIMGGVSGGPVILARAGLMHNRRMTVHWEHAEVLKELHPELALERTLYVFDRDRITCAGGIAPMDMMHELVSRHHGTTFARKVSDWFLHTDVRPAFGPQRGGLVARYRVTHSAALATIEAMENNISEPLSLGQLAAVAGLSIRQLNRLFRDKLGATTMSVYRDIRLAKARQLLTQSALSVTEIALATGFAGSAHFADAFRRSFGVAPTALRRSQRP